MGRKSTFSDQQIFAAVSQQIATGQPLRIQELAKTTGVSIGSLYHRYASREGLLALTWLDALLASHERFLQALQSGAPDAGEQAALATPRFARAEHDRAVILCLGQGQTLLTENAPAAHLATAHAANERAKQALMDFAARNKLGFEACLHGIVAFPLAAVKLYLPHKRVPRSAEAFVSAAYHAAIGIAAP